MTVGLGAEMPDIAGIDVGDGQDHQDVGGAEAPVDHSAPSEGRAQPQVALDDRMQRAKRGLLVDHILGDEIHGRDMFRQLR